jgi:hypothetical protein
VLLHNNEEHQRNLPKMPKVLQKFKFYVLKMSINKVPTATAKSSFKSVILIFLQNNVDCEFLNWQSL